MGTAIVFIAIIIAISLIIWGFAKLVFNVDLITLFFLPDIVNGFFVLISLAFQIVGLFFSRAGLAFLFLVVIVLGLLIDALKYF